MKMRTVTIKVCSPRPPFRTQMSVTITQTDDDYRSLDSLVRNRFPFSNPLNLKVKASEWQTV